MRSVLAALALSMVWIAPAGAQLALQRPDDGINPAQPAPDPMLDEPIVRRPPAASAAPAVSKPAPASIAKKPVAPARKTVVTAAKAPAPKAGGGAIGFRQCADAYFAGASLLRADPTAVDTLLQRAQIAGERQLKAAPSQDRAQLIQAIKMTGTTRAAEIRALDDDAGPKAAQNLFKIIRQCDAKLNLSITGPLTLKAGEAAHAGGQ